MATGEVTVRVADMPAVRNLIEIVTDAIGALENGDHHSVQQNVASELRDALQELAEARR